MATGGFRLISKSGSNAPSPLVGIIVHNYNGGANLQRFLESCSLLAYRNYHVFVVDNGSNDDSEKPALHFPKTSLIKLTRNEGVEAVNVGIRAALSASARYVFVADNDTVLATDILSVLVEVMEADSSVGVAAPATFKLGSPRELERYALGTMLDRRTGNLTAVSASAFSGRDQIEVDVVGASLMRASMLQRIGLYDRIYFLYSTDNDICARAKLGGYRVIVCPRAKLWHAGSSTTRRVTGFKSYYFAANRLIFLRKFAKIIDSSLTFSILLNGFIQSVGTEIAMGRSLTLIAKALIMGTTGTACGLAYFYTGRYPDLFWARRVLYIELESKSSFKPQRG